MILWDNFKYYELKGSLHFTIHFATEREKGISAYFFRGNNLARCVSCRLFSHRYDASIGKKYLLNRAQENWNVGKLERSERMWKFIISVALLDQTVSLFLIFHILDYANAIYYIINTKSIKEICEADNDIFIDKFKNILNFNRKMFMIYYQKREVGFLI